MQDLSLNLVRKHHLRIKKYCAPLQAEYGINWVSFSKIRKDGALIHLNNMPHVSHSYFEQKAYTCDPLLRSPGLLPNGITLYEEIPSAEYQQLHQNCVEDFGINLGYIYIENQAEEVTLLSIGAPRLYSNQLSHYINQLPVIKRFFAYFLDETEDLLRKIDHDPLDLAPLVGENFYRQDFTISGDKHTRQAFIESISKQKNVISELTLREKQCLQLMARGKSLKQMAADLALSPRTIENYINQLKQKFDCFSKANLLNKAKELADLQLLD